MARDEQGIPCSASGMFVSRNVKSFEEILRNLIFRFQIRLDLSNNELVCSTVNVHYLMDSKFRKHWQRLVNVGITQHL